MPNDPIIRPDLPSYLDDAIEMVDASIFTGDDFIAKPDRIQYLRRMMERWERGLAEAESAVEDADADAT